MKQPQDPEKVGRFIAPSSSATPCITARGGEWRHMTPEELKQHLKKLGVTDIPEFRPGETCTLHHWVADFLDGKRSALPPADYYDHRGKVNTKYVNGATQEPKEIKLYNSKKFNVMEYTAIKPEDLGRTTGTKCKLYAMGVRFIPKAKFRNNVPLATWAHKFLQGWETTLPGAIMQSDLDRMTAEPEEPPIKRHRTKEQKPRNMNMLNAAAMSALYRWSRPQYWVGSCFPTTELGWRSQYNRTRAKFSDRPLRLFFAWFKERARRKIVKRHDPRSWAHAERADLLRG